MKTKIVQILFIVLSTVLAAACQDMWPSFGGAKPPFLLALALHWAFIQPTVDKDDRRAELPPFYTARWIPAVLFAGAFEDALSGFPIGCATGYFLLVGTGARFIQHFAVVLKSAALGFVAVTICAPLHEVWLAVWGVVGEENALFIRFFASVLPAAPVGALLFFLLPRIETAIGFEGTLMERRLA